MRKFSVFVCKGLFFHCFFLVYKKSQLKEKQNGGFPRRFIFCIFLFIQLLQAHRLP